jgi:hypothetical protein
VGKEAPAATYENVIPLVESVNSADGKTFEYLFRCPETGFKATGKATVPEIEVPGTKRSLREELTSNMGLSGLRDSLERKFPGGTLAADAAEMAAFWKRDKKKKRKDVAEGKARLERAEQQLVLDAFATVANEFEWDAKAERWVKAGS